MLEWRRCIEKIVPGEQQVIQDVCKRVKAMVSVSSSAEVFRYSKAQKVWMERCRFDQKSKGEQQPLKSESTRHLN